MHFFAPLALAALVAATPAAEAAPVSYPSYGSSSDISDVLTKLSSYVSLNSGLISSSQASLIGVSLNGVIAGLVGIGLDVSVL